MTEKQVILGTGPLGLAIMDALVKKGDAPQIVLVNRSGKVSESLPAGVEVVASDVRDAAKVAEVTQGATIVYHTAQPAYTRWVQEFPAMQTAILEGVIQSGARLVIGENLYMYADTNGTPLQENLPYNSHTRKGTVRSDISKMATAARKTGRLKLVIGRGSDFYGPRVLDSSIGERLFGGILNGKGAEIIGSADQPHDVTYIEDFGRALVTLGASDKAYGRAWHVPNAPTVTMREFVAIIAKILGKPVEVKVMSGLMLRIGGLFIPEARESVEMLYEFVKPFRVDHSDYANAYGDDYTPMEEALRRTLAWYQAHEAAGALVKA